MKKARHKIIVLDGYTLNPGDLSWEKLEALGSVTIYDRTALEDIVTRIGDADIILTNKTPITRETIEATDMKFIGVLATGFNVVDVVAAREKGIPVCNVPTYGTDGVSQFAFGLLLEVCHHIGEHSQSVLNGDWQRSDDWCYWKSPQIELSGKTAGVIGFGRIGQQTGKMLSAAGMNILAYDVYPSENGRKYAQYVDLDQLFALSDVIFLHCPQSAETEGMINAKNISKMKDNVIIINNSRGGLIVERDLADALRSGKIRAAALDVVSSEPIKSDNPLLSTPNCIITPHISWASIEARSRLMDIVVNNISKYLQGKLINKVN